MRLRPALMLALIANLAFVTALTAQDRETSIEQARRLMEQGQTYYLQGRFGEAAAEFEAAYQAEPFSAFLFNAGVAYENARDSRRAVEFFRLYLERDPSASDRAAVEQRIERLSAAIAAAEAAARPPDPQITEGTGAGGTGEGGVWIGQAALLQAQHTNTSLGQLITRGCAHGAHAHHDHIKRSYHTRSLTIGD